MGRELIFPAAISEFYPDWLNHATHSIIVPLNILLALLVNHKYARNGAALTIVYFILYTSLLFYIKHQTGLFVYKYLDTMNQQERIIYFASLAVFIYLLYKSGQLLTSLAHKQAAQRPAIRKSKQK